MKLLTVLFSLTILSFIIWLPFGARTTLPVWKMDFSEGPIALWKNYDGPNYLIVAKTWYDKTLIKREFSAPLPVEYYPAHLPLYPLIISFFDSFLPGPNGMLVATFLGSVLCFGMFYLYLREFKLSTNAVWLCLVFLLLPARFVALRAIGSPEPWLIFFTLASLYSFKKEKFWFAGLWGVLAMLTKSPAVLLWASYAIFALVDSIKQKRFLGKYLPLLLMPLAVLALFYFYYLRTGDFWAYFNSGDNIHLFWPPFSVFTTLGQAWVGNFWLEDIIWTWLFFGLGTLKLRRPDTQVEFYYAGLFFLSTLFVAHRDMGRYIIPIAPLVLVGLDKYMQKKEFKVMLAILVLPILLYSWNFLLHNISPVSDWAPYL